LGTPAEDLQVEASDGKPATWTAEAEEEDMDRFGPANVWIHIYHMDSYTGFLNNWAGLKYAEIPIHHTGIEVYGEEWCFNYFEDSWDNDAISGVINCIPRNMPGYQYQESICLGPTPLVEYEVDDLIMHLREEWPANSYHITRRNCMDFAKAYVELLRPRKPWPAHAHGINDFTKRNPLTDGVVDYGWNWAKWYMRRKWATEEETTQPAAGSVDAN
jgi:hypothetical protein